MNAIILMIESLLNSEELIITEDQVFRRASLNRHYSGIRLKLPAKSYSVRY
jgi:hypothetical protein